MTDALQLRDEVEESLTEGELPEQGGGQQTPTILPGIHLFQLPANIDQCWEAKDYEKKDADGNVITGSDGKPLVEQHLMLKFDKDTPLVCVDNGGYFSGLPATSTISTMGRRRGKRNDPKAPVVSDMTYLLRDSLNDMTPIKLRKDYIPAINRHAGEVIRVETGLQAQCDPERVRYVFTGEGMNVVEDPDGTKGCNNAAGKASPPASGSRLYTNDFKIKVFRLEDTGEVYNTRDEGIAAAQALGLPLDHVKAVDMFTDRVACKSCGAALRGFFRIERFLKPLGTTQQA
jgi:hypothetical protein